MGHPLKGGRAPIISEKGSSKMALLDVGVASWDSPQTSDDGPGSHHFSAAGPSRGLTNRSEGVRGVEIHGEVFCLEGAAGHQEVSDWTANVCASQNVCKLCAHQTDRCQAFGCSAGRCE